MADRVNPSGIRDAPPLITAAAVRYGGGDWIAESTVDYYASEDGLAGAPLNAFQIAGTSGLDLTVDTGEAFVGGAWLGRDTQTTVTLQGQVSNQTIYLGWRPSKTNKVIVGRDDASQSDFQASDPRIPIIEASTNATSVTSSTFVGPIGEQINKRNEGSVSEADHASNASHAAKAQEAVLSTKAEKSARGQFSVPPQSGSGEGGEILLEGDSQSGDVSIDSYYDGSNKQARIFGSFSQFKIDASPLLTAALLAEGKDLRNVGTVSATNANVGGSPVLTADGSQNWGNAQNAGGNNLINLGDPAGAQHAVTLSYLARHYSSVDAREPFKEGLAVTDGNFDSTLHITVNDAPNGSNIQLIPNRNGFKFGKTIENRALDDNWKLYGTPLTEKGPIVSGQKDYKIVKNGNDGNGIINFKT